MNIVGHVNMNISLYKCNENTSLVHVFHGIETFYKIQHIAKEQIVMACNMVGTGFDTILYSMYSTVMLTTFGSSPVSLHLSFAVNTFNELIDTYIDKEDPVFITSHLIEYPSFQYVSFKSLSAVVKFNKFESYDHTPTVLSIKTTEIPNNYGLQQINFTKGNH